MMAYSMDVVRYSAGTFSSSELNNCTPEDLMRFALPLYQNQFQRSNITTVQLITNNSAHLPWKAENALMALRRLFRLYLVPYCNNFPQRSGTMLDTQLSVAGMLIFLEGLWSRISPIEIALLSNNTWWFTVARRYSIIWRWYIFPSLVTSRKFIRTWGRIP